MLHTSALHFVVAVIHTVVLTVVAQRWVGTVLLNLHITRSFQEVPVKYAVLRSVVHVNMP
jgi:hypothetical protein